MAPFESLDTASYSHLQHFQMVPVSMILSDL